ncbi:glycosyl hydrolase family 18 protein [Corallococcus sp. BB11-1]|uniref:glycosyl hydrolase family 18 protein n=1 Tax=Corallococcus sp. BB11-1 TaxID=2996783 RepID=UPI00226E0998|nr:glycosyl hydrolase family 18 protein [Corallococcus sp. BB11-1]MCY1032314.1 glycosyl hydrolase family 18 protein [Corallococcus sp. BB11-1]
MNKPRAVPARLWVGLTVAVMLGGCDFGLGGGPAKPEDGPPEAPKQVVAQPADGSALVTWTVPPKDGGSPLLYYVVRCVPECGGALVTAPDTQAMIRGLNNGLTYVFKVAAVNAFGEGKSSSETELVTPQAGMSIPNPTVPGQPRSVVPTAGNAQAYVSWLAPASYGGQPLTYFKVTAEPGGATVTVNAPVSGALIPGLLNGIPYHFTVCAANELGEGPCVRTSQPVRPRAGGAPTSWVMGYWTGYQKDLYPVDTVDMSLLTHVVMGRIVPGIDGTLTTNFDVSDHEGPLIAKALAQRAHNAGKKALLMLGGEGAHNGFRSATETVEKRRNLALNIIRVMRELGYDGVDVDWEPIELPEDGPPLLALLDDLRAADEKIFLTVPVGWVNTNFPLNKEAVDFHKELLARVDQMNIMSYNMNGHHGQWDSWHSSALFGEGGHHPTSVSSSVKAFLDAGVPAQRIGVGIGFFGTCWKGVTEPRTPLDGRPGVVEEKSDNAMSYFNIQTYYHLPEAYRWDKEARVPYLSHPTAFGPQACNYISYEDIPSVTEKGRWARELGLGGGIIWTINQGHFPKAPEGQKDPLLKAVHTAFLKP